MSQALLLLGVLLSSWASADVKTVEEKWPDGSLKMRQEVSDNLRGRMVPNGLETHYLLGGVKESEATYRLGVKEGPWREYYPSGVLKIEGTYHQGKKDGLETLYTENSQKASELHYQDGERNGKTIDWAGSIKVYEADYDHDKLVGVVQEWYDDGAQKSVRHFKAGIEEGLEQGWFHDGRKFIEANYVAGQRDGDYHEWFSNGQPKYVTQYKHGSPNGKFQEWFSDGAPKSVGQYVDGQMDGAWKEWKELPEKDTVKEDAAEILHPAETSKKTADTASASPANSAYGDLLSAVTGQKQDSVKPSDKDSDKPLADKHPDGENSGGKDDAQNSAASGEKGADVATAGDSAADQKIPEHPLSAERNYKRGMYQGKQMTYHDNGQKQLEVNVDEGRREGPYTEWYDNGQVRSIGKYFHDQLNGEVDYWYQDGRPWAVNNFFHGSPVGRSVEWDEKGNPIAR